MTGQPRWAHVTYASFRNRAGSGGWHTGPSVEATSEEEALVMEYAPTSVVPTAPIDDFISAGEIAELPRRFEYLPLGDRGLFMQSVPAGKDATGRPGNVFTHAAIDRDLAEPLSATYPVNLYRSPDLQTPFRIAEVEAVELDPQLQEPRPGPLTDLSVAWTMVTTMLGNRSGALFRLQDVLSEGETTPVLVLKSSNEAVYWLQVLSSTLSPAESRRLLRFSTFERAQALPTALPNQHHPVLVVPVADKDELRRRSGITVIDPADPETQQSVPRTTWALLTMGVLDVGVSPASLVELLTTESGGETKSFGDALARVVRSRPGDFGVELAAVAERHLAESPRAPSPAVVDADLDLVRRVVDDPRLVLGQHVWPDVRPPKVPEREFDTLAVTARGRVPGLASAPTDVLVGYLNFLLRTGLVPAEDVQNPEFRGLFRDADSFRGAPHLPMPPSAHPDLLTLLTLADRERKQTIRAPRPAGERITRALGSGRSRDEIVAWLRRSDTLEILRDWRDGRVISTSSRDFSHDMLRVYYAVCLHLSVEPFISGDRAADDELLDVLGELMLEAVEKGLKRRLERRDTPPPTTTEFRDLGRTVAEDILSAGHRPVLLDRILADVERHRDKEKLDGMGRGTAQIVAAVASGITEQTREARRGEDSE